MYVRPDILMLLDATTSAFIQHAATFVSSETPTVDRAALEIRAEAQRLAEIIQYPGVSRYKFDGFARMASLDVIGRFAGYGDKFKFYDEVRRSIADGREPAGANADAMRAFSRVSQRGKARDLRSDVMTLVARGARGDVVATALLDDMIQDRFTRKFSGAADVRQCVQDQVAAHEEAAFYASLYLLRYHTFSSDYFPDHWPTLLRMDYEALRAALGAMDMTKAVARFDAGERAGEVLLYGGALAGNDAARSHLARVHHAQNASPANLPLSREDRARVAILEAALGAMGVPGQQARLLAAGTVLRRAEILAWAERDRSAAVLRLSEGLGNGLGGVALQILREYPDQALLRGITPCLASNSGPNTSESEVYQSFENLLAAQGLI